ncbi:transmembrane protein 130 isoform X1 [Osmerus eperlanus]|uniref:transmembrane protein 130 isoform X1 n=1 Tax=Osmerus eperlanus TaxID=29151 RepID=UPI002E10675F
MYRNKLAWVCLSLPLILSLTVYGATDELISLENVAGKLLFYQKEGNATYLRDSGELASEITTEAMFELFDPRNTLRTAHFSYTWDFGNGEVIKGFEPFVTYNYMASGNYTLRLRVGANVTKHATILTGVYSMDVTVLDAIKNIKLTGPTTYQVSQNTSLAVHVDGSPPMWVCWRILPNCVTDTTVGCQLTMLYENTLKLNHTFTSTGVHCLDISARNEVSSLQTSYSFFVRRDPFSNLFFILPCAAILMATFCFIAVVACRPWRGNKMKPKMAAYSSRDTFPQMELREAPGPSPLYSSIQPSSAGRAERQPLIMQHGTRPTLYQTSPLSPSALSK